jgi:hypothetical protein
LFAVSGLEPSAGVSEELVVAVRDDGVPDVYNKFSKQA